MTFCHTRGMSVGTRLERAWTLAGMKQGQFARLIAVDPSTVSGWKTGKRAQPRGLEEALPRIIAVLAHHGVIVSKTWLLTGEGEPPSPKVGGASSERGPEIYQDSAATPGDTSESKEVAEMHEVVDAILEFYPHGTAAEKLNIQKILLGIAARLRKKGEITTNPQLAGTWSR